MTLEYFYKFKKTGIKLTKHVIKINLKKFRQFLKHIKEYINCKRKVISNKLI